jgi:hypothetical protein
MIERLVDGVLMGDGGCFYVDGRKMQARSSSKRGYRVSRKVYKSILHAPASPRYRQSEHQDQSMR